MFKKQFNIVIMLIVGVCFFVVSDTMAQPSNINAKGRPSIVIDPLGFEKIELPQISKEDLATRQAENSTSPESSTSPITTQGGPAPALYYLEVYAVGSSDYGGWEYIDPSQTQTLYDHGGALFQVVTLELGYGGNRIGRMVGAPVINFDSKSLCWNSSGYLTTECTGRTIVGWLRWWDVSGYQNGYFTYQSTSLNFPWNTMYDSIFIQ